MCFFCSVFSRHIDTPMVQDMYDRSRCDVSSCLTHLLRTEESHSERYYLQRCAVLIICQRINKLCTPRVAGGIGLGLS